MGGDLHAFAKEEFKAREVSLAKGSSSAKRDQYEAEAHKLRHLPVKGAEASHFFFFKPGYLLLHQKVFLGRHLGAALDLVRKIRNRI